MRNPNLCSLVCCPVPCQVDGTPVLCISASAASPYVGVCFVFSDDCFSLYDSCYYFCPFISTFPRVSRVGLAPPVGHRMLVWFFELCVAALFFSFLFYFFLAFRLVLSCHPSVGPSPRHIVGLIVPANNNLVPSGLGLRACMKFLFRFSFLSSLLNFAPFAPFCPSLYNSHL